MSMHQILTSNEYRHSVAPYVVSVPGAVFHKVQSEEIGWAQFRLAEEQGHVKRL